MIFFYFAWLFDTHNNNDFQFKTILPIKISFTSKSVKNSSSKIFVMVID